MKIGQKVFIKTTGNAARYSGSKIIETEISKIGRKYLEVENLNGVKFLIENLKEVTNYSTEYILYLSEKDLLLEIESMEITSFLRDYFSKLNPKTLDIDKLRQIKSIIKD